MKHIFIYVRLSQHDIFSGLREKLKNDQRIHHEMVDIHLSSENYALFDEVELSNKRFFRFFYYQKFFFEIETLLKDAIQGSSIDSSEIVVYIADEGVWAVLLEFFWRKWGLHFTRVNVQHGFMYLERPSEFSLFGRQILNKISTALTGYPSLGLGFGSGLFDTYLVYGEKEKEFIESVSSASAYACSGLIKKDFIEYYRSVKKNISVTQKLILFALPYETLPISTSIKCTLNEIFQEIIPLGNYLSETYNTKILLRFHPGADRTNSLAFFNNCELRNYAVIDDEENVTVGIAKSVAVMSYDSTVLFEAGLVGIPPIIILGRCCQQSTFTFPHEIVDLNGDYRAMLDQALSKDTIAQYLRSPDDNLSELDWGKTIVQLASTS